MLQRYILNVKLMLSLHQLFKKQYLSNVKVVSSNQPLPFSQCKAEG